LKAFRTKETHITPVRPSVATPREEKSPAGGTLSKSSGFRGCGHCSRIGFLAYESTGLERNTSEKNYSPVRDLNPEPPEFKPGAHLTRPPQHVN
jgi:hypothetical protein